MPLSDYEQRILEDIERRLAEDDPRLADQVARTSLYSHLARRVRRATLAFIAGLAMLALFFVSIWIALIGFAVMLTSALIVYRDLKRIGQDQLRSMSREGRTLPGFLARLTSRFRGERPPAE
ncbi:MAG: DUF3040 domain-containing protein [Actinomycetota bacterium]